MILEKDNLEQLRRPSELHQFFEDTKKIIAANKEDRCQANLITRPYKPFWEEILPLSVFCKFHYPADDVFVKPVIGNQGFDAEVYDEQENLITKIEIKWPRDGESEREEAQCIKKQGWVARVFEDNEYNANVLAPIITKTLEDLNKHDYSDCILLIALDLFPISLSHKPQSDQLTTLISKMKKDLSKESLCYWPQEAYLVFINWHIEESEEFKQVIQLF